MVLKIGWFSTGRDAAARNLLKTIVKKKDEGFFDIEIAFVFSNWEEDEDPTHPTFEDRRRFCKLVRGFDIPLVCLSWKKFRPDLRLENREKWRSAYGEKMRELISPFPFDLGVLAGYMLWMDNESCKIFNLINLHPALPGGPKGTWQQVIWQLMESRADRQGAMIHLCTQEWDEGAPLTFCSFSLRTAEYEVLWEQFERKLESVTLAEIMRTEGENEPLFARIRKDGEIREIPLLAYTLKYFADGKLRIKDRMIYEKERPLAGAYDLTALVDHAVKTREFEV
ncbi:MAG: formyltransferase family protein [Methanomassiliicoccales archaeon]